MKPPASLAEAFRMSAALDQESFKARCAQTNDIAELVCLTLEEWLGLRSHGGDAYERARVRLDIARAERRRRKREETRAA